MSFFTAYNIVRQVSKRKEYNSGVKMAKANLLAKRKKESR